MDGVVRERAVEILPRIREEAARTEAERRIPTEVLAALLDTGVFSLEPDPDGAARSARLLEVVGVVAGACGSTGWLTAHAGAVPGLLDLFPTEARAMVRGGDGADPLTAFSPEPGGRLRETDGELHVEGRWAAVTGASHAAWLVLACRRPDAGTPGPVGLLLVRAEDCRMEDPVDTIGLTATGAQDVEIAAVVVQPEQWLTGSPEVTVALTRFGAAAAMAVLGAAGGALEIHLAQITQRGKLSQGGEEVTARDLSPARAARAASQLDAAALVLAEQSGDGLDPDAPRRDPLDDQLYAIERAVEATGLVFATVRSHALDNDDPVARLWRDVRVGAHHARELVHRLRAISG